MLNEKQKHLINLVSDSVADVLYYNRKEDDYISVQDVEEILTTEVIDEMVNKFRDELLKNKVD